MENIIQQFINGLFTGSLYALVTIGVTLVFGLTKLVNFAHGQMVLIGAFIALMVGTGDLTSLVISLLVAGVAVGLLGSFFEYFLFRHTLSRPINGFVVSLGLVILIQSALALYFGSNPRSVASPLQGSVEIFGASISATRVLVLCIALALSAAFYLFLRFTMLGTALRACSVDHEAATVLGIPAPRVMNLAFFVGSALAGAAGVLLAVTVPFSPFSGTPIVVKAFVIALAGGLGSISGAVWLSFALGVGEAFMSSYGLIRYSETIVFMFILMLLLFRPQGLFRGTEA